MKLRRIEILGFKSFRSKTAVDIANGVTAVVGPNGCGKSNVVDAVRWAMGSQSPKDLRGRAMEDVIFAGSENHRPMGVAEVSLILENDRGDVPMEWKEVAELKITRRLFRTGDSEYEINGTRCRLRDIQSIFLGTGVGAKEAYSIIEQGRIGFIVSARPDERRVIIEEAAGITRYKYQRNVAERRLDKTRDNLLRVGDILAEVSRQLGALERQAKKAARWRELSERKRTLEIVLALHRRDRAKEALATAQQALEVAKQTHGDTTSVLGAIEARHESGRVNVAARERKAREITEESYQARARADLLKNNVSHLERERDSARGRLQQTKSESGQQLELVQTAESELERVTIEVGQIEAMARLARERLAEREREHSSAREELVAVASRQRALSSSLTESRGRLAALSAQLDTIASERGAIAERSSELSGELESAQSAKDEAAAAAEEAEVVAATSSEALERAQDALDSARGRERERVEAVSEARRTESAARDALAAAEQRRDSLTARLEAGESHGEGARLVLDEARAGRLSGVVGGVAERLGVEAGADVAVSAVLGDLADGIVVDSAEDALAAAAVARDAGVAVVLIPLSGGVDAPIAGVCSPTAPLPRSVHERLKNADITTDALSAGETDGLRVDSSRVVVEGDGVVRVGAGAGSAAEAVMRLSRDRDAAVEEIERARMASDEAIARLGAVEEQLEDAMHARQSSAERLAACEAERNRAANAAAEAARQRDVFAARVRQAESDAQRAVARGQELAKRAERASAEREELEGNVESASKELAGFEHRVAEAERVVAAASDALSSQRVEVAQLDERLSNQRRSVERLQREVERAAARSKNLRSEGGRIEERLTALDRELTRDRARLTESLAKAQELETRRAEAQSAYEKAQSELREVEAELFAARQGAGETASGLQNAELQVERARAEVEHAEEAIVERFQMSVSAAKRQVAEVSYEDGLREELQKVDRSLERLGPVNYAAEEEYAEATERHEFLTTQKADLETAMQDLESAIRKMDKTSRELFKEMFDAVNERFQELYPRLFPGGRGRLEMTEPDNLLETGIEIAVQPPGKRLQSMTLMSGGEKAMTAVALVFSIFSLKPTPFCILDEVDAPLDDANVGRFTSIVREMSDHSQFLIITHNKVTMEAAQTLYGVTMEEPGVSKVVGVRLQAERTGGSESERVA